jgi:hypothetical protein
VYTVDTRGAVTFDNDELQSTHRIVGGTLTLGPAVSRSLSAGDTYTKIIGGPTSSGTLLFNPLLSSATIQKGGVIKAGSDSADLAPNLGATATTPELQKPYKWTIDEEWVQ